MTKTNFFFVVACLLAATQTTFAQRQTTNPPGTLEDGYATYHASQTEASPWKLPSRVITAAGDTLVLGGDADGGYTLGGVSLNSDGRIASVRRPVCVMTTDYSVVLSAFLAEQRRSEVFQTIPGKVPTGLFEKIAPTAAQGNANACSIPKNFPAMNIRGMVAFPEGLACATLLDPEKGILHIIYVQGEEIGILLRK